MIEERKDFFISYHQADLEWAHWLGWELEQAGYPVILDQWDLYTGDNFVAWLHRALSAAAQVLIVLSEDYLAAHDREREWTAALLEGRLFPVRVRPCHVKGVLASLRVLDLCNLGQEQARSLLRTELDKSQGTRGKPLQRPTFPGRNHLSYPGVKTAALVGSTLAQRYQVVGRLAGEGGMGEVYLAKELASGEWRAIKVLKRHLLSEPETLARFLREGKTAMGIRHSGVVKVLDQGESDGFGPFLVMEYLDGRTLREWMHEWPPGRPGQAKQVLPLFRGIAATLAAMHANQVIHRDLKPENVMVMELGDARLTTKVLDFGLAGHPAARQTPPLALTGADAEYPAGTPAYMAPECWDPSVGDISEKTDVYALGMMLYEGVCGKLPFQELDADLLRVAHMSRKPPSPGKRLPQGVAELLTQMLAKQPDARPTMVQVERDLAVGVLPNWFVPIAVACFTMVVVVTYNVLPGKRPPLVVGSIPVGDLAVTRDAFDLAKPKDLAIARETPDLAKPKDLAIANPPREPPLRVQFVAERPDKFTLSCHGVVVTQCAKGSAEILLPPHGSCTASACGSDEKDYHPRVFSYEALKREPGKAGKGLRVKSVVLE